MSTARTPGVRLNSITEALFAKGYQTADCKSTHEEGTVFRDSNDNIGIDTNELQPTLCCECGSVIRNAANLAVHMRRHLGYKPFLCSNCSYTGYDEDDVKRHANRSHSVGNTAMVNFKPSEDMESLVLEMINKGKVVDSAGSQQMSSPPQLTAAPHKSTLSPSAPSPLIQTLLTKGLNSCQTQNGESNLLCLMCDGYVVYDTKAVIQHLKSHLNITGSCACPLCSLSFVSWSLLSDHVKSVHKDDSAATDSLGQVRQVFGRAMATAAELAFSTTQEKPKLPCALCNEQVVFNSTNLEHHLDEHNGYFPYKCSICTQLFTNLQSLKGHFQMIHPNTFPLFTFTPEFRPATVIIPFERAYPILSIESLESITSQLALTNGQATAMIEPADPNDSTSGSAMSGLSDDFNSKMNTISCLLCSVSISRNLSCLIAHAKVHLSYKPLKCEYCTFRHFAMSKIRRHNIRVHPGKSVKVSYHPVSDIGRQVKEMKLKCFGEQASSAGWANGDDQHDFMDEDDDLSPTPLPIGNATSPTFSEEMLKSPMVSPGYNNTPAVSKLLEQLIKNNPLPPQASLAVDHLAASMVSPNQNTNRNNLRDTMASPDMGTPSGRSSYETYDLSGMGKKVCSVCNTYIANNPSSFENHACKHLDYKPYHCHYCAYQSYIRGKVTRHIQQVHSGLPIKISHRPLPGIKEKIHNMKMRCFPFLSGDCSDQRGGLAGGQGAAEEVECLVCFASVAAFDCSMDEHLQIHIPVKYYHCPVCTYQTTYLIRAKQHVHSAHPTSQETRILCCPPEGIKGLQSLRNKCYGSSIWARYGQASSTGEGDNQDNIMDDSTTDDVPLPVCTGDDEDDVMLAQMKGENSRINCGICKALISNQSTTISSHVRNHLSDYKPYQCSYCVWTSSVESEVKQHILSVHKGVPLKVLYNPEREELKKMHELCFPKMNNDVGRSVSPLMVTDAPMLASGATLLKKLSCQVCKNTIADNPKSIGIHVKNHLNYKPYRCPFCKYMSCEQSKARRHVEHVHNVSGETVEIHAEENIKERIADMKARCFPSLIGDYDSYDEVAVYVNEDSNDLMADFKCYICQDSVSAQMIDAHVRTHLGKPFKCAYCTNRFWTEEKVRVHLQTTHMNHPQQFDDQQATLDGQFSLIKSKCFPDLVPQTEMKNDELLFDDDGDNNDSGQYGSSMRSSGRKAAEGKLICRVCDNQVSVNPNSIEVHAKTHLNFKQHQCGYCTYRSCISGKVKRHLDNVHRGQEISVLSFSTLPLSIKQVIAEMRTACFPQLEGDQIQRTPVQLNRWADNLKRRIIEELQNLDTTNLEPQEVAAAKSTTDAALAAAPASLRSELSAATHLSMVSADYLNTSNNGFETDLDSASNRDDCETPSGGDNVFGKLQCSLCSCLVADNPSSLGLHVRNHLDYKPFSCNLCDYKSCIQAKVKRHLRNVHKCPTDEMTYSPEPDIRLKVMDMKMRCFPKMIEAAESAMGFTQAFSGATMDYDLYNNRGDSTSSLNRMIDNMLDAKLNAGLLNSKELLHDDMINDDTKFNGFSSVAKCQMCDQEVCEKERNEHLTKHGLESRWHCSECDFNGFTESEIKEHAVENHPNGSPQPIRFDGTDFPLTEEDINKLEQLCFPPQFHTGESTPSGSETPLGDEQEDDEEEEMDADNESETTSIPEKGKTGRRNNLDGPRYICQLCGQAVSMYASSLYVHVKNHMNYKPYCCAHCDYRSPVKSKVRRHIQNAHRKQPMTINYFPTPGIEHEVLRMKKKCFPDVTSFATLTNDKIPCLLCKTDVADTPLSKSVHAKNHLNSKPYHCGYCSYRSCLKGETRRHVTRQHVGKPVRILFREEETVDRDSVDRMIGECFTGEIMDSSSSINDLIATTAHFSQTTELSAEQAKSAVASVQPIDGSETSVRIKLGPAYREWYCPYCAFSDTSKYHVKEHCLSDHPGKPVHVSGVKCN